MQKNFEVRREKLLTDIRSRMSSGGLLRIFLFCHRPASLRFAATATSRERPVEIKRTGPKPAEEAFARPLKTLPALKLPEAALRAIHGYECAVRGA